MLDVDYLLVIDLFYCLSMLLLFLNAFVGYLLYWPSKFSSLVFVQVCVCVRENLQLSLLIITY